MKDKTQGKRAFSAQLFVVVCNVSDIKAKYYSFPPWNLKKQLLQDGFL